MNTIAGLLVVRQPDQNFDKEGRGAFSAVPPRIGNVFYGGVDRMAWFDLDEDFYNKSLPNNLLEIRQSLKSNDLTGICLCYDFRVANTVLGYCNRETMRNEIIAIRSRKLVEIKNKSLPSEEHDIDWLGFDFVSLGHWSLLQAGMFASPSYFARWNNELNQYGLLSDPSIIDEFARDYSVAAGKGGVEPFPDNGYGLEIIEIGRVRTNGDKYAPYNAL